MFWETVLNEQTCKLMYNATITNETQSKYDDYSQRCDAVGNTEGACTSYNAKQFPSLPNIDMQFMNSLIRSNTFLAKLRRISSHTIHTQTLTATIISQA